MQEFDSDEYFRRQGLSADEAQAEIDALIATCEASREVSLSLYGYIVCPL